MAVNERENQSVYCATAPANERCSQPLYRAVNEWISKVHLPGNKVCDLGCSDLVATHQLPGGTVIGIDLSLSALTKAKTDFPSACLINANIEAELPLSQNKKVDVVVMLDILEHLPKNIALKLLTGLGDVFTHRPLSVILSLPIVSLKSIPCVIEFARTITRGRLRNETGLFDRTHLWFGDRDDHKRIINGSGYSIVESEVTCWQYDVTGFEPVLGIKKKPRKYMRLANRAIGVPAESTGDKFKNTWGYQGLYLAKL